MTGARKMFTCWGRCRACILFVVALSLSPSTAFSIGTNAPLRGLGCRGAAAGNNLLFASVKMVGDQAPPATRTTEQKARLAQSRRSASLRHQQRVRTSAKNPPVQQNLASEQARSVMRNHGSIAEWRSRRIRSSQISQNQPSCSFVVEPLHFGQGNTVTNLQGSFMAVSMPPRSAETVQERTVGDAGVLYLAMKLQGVPDIRGLDILPKIQQRHDKM